MLLRLLSLFLFAPVLALAQTERREIVRAEPYFKESTCNVIMKDTAGATFENLLVSQIETEAQAFQLLYDYDFILSANHETAVKEFIRESGAQIPNFESAAQGIAAGADQALAFWNGVDAWVKRVGSFEGEEGRQSLRKITAHLERLAASMEGSTAVQRTAHAKIRNLALEMQKLDGSHPLNQAFRKYNRAVLAAIQAEGVAYLVPKLREMTEERWDSVSLISEYAWPRVGFLFCAVGTMAVTWLERAGEFLIRNHWDTDGNIPTFLSNHPGVFWPVALSGAALHQFFGWKSFFKARKAQRSAERDQQAMTGLTLESVAGEAQTVAVRSPLPKLPVKAKADDQLSATWLAPLPNRMIPSLKEAAQKVSVLDFSPVALNYLGDAELLELKERSDVLLHSLGRAPGYVEAAKKVTRALVDDPENYRLQVQFISSLKRLFSQRPAAEIEKDWGDFIESYTKVQEQLEKIRTIPYQVLDDSNEMAINLGQFLVHRLSSDLHQLAELEVDATTLKESVAELTAHQAEVSRILEMAGYKKDWKKVAEGAELFLERL